MSSTKTLHQAIVNRDVALIKKIFEGEDAWKSTDDQGETVLHLAFKCQLKSSLLEESIIETLECLLDEGLDINLQNAVGRTVLFLAVEDQLPHVTDFLVQRGANVNARDQNGNTIVHFFIEDQLDVYSRRGSTLSEFIEQDHINSITWLLSTGVNVHLRNNNRETAFDLAIQRNFKHILPTLIQHMKDDNYIIHDGCTIMQSLFLTSGNVIIKTLFNISVNTNTRYDVEIIDSLLTFVDRVGQYGNTLVHRLLKWCGKNPEIIQRALQSYTNVNAQDENGNTALHLVVKDNFYDWQENPRHTINAVRTLLSKGMNVNLQNHNGDSPVSLAFLVKNFEVVKALLEIGADVSPSTHPNALFLHDISSVPSIEDEVWAPMVDTLVRAGWNVNEVRSRDQFTPLMEACRRCRPAIAQKLIDNCANVNYLVKKSLMRPIHVAATPNRSNQGSNTEALFKVLAMAGAKVNATNERGETALHLAAHCDCLTVVRLLKSGANVDARDKEGRSPLHEAVERGNVGAVIALMQFGAEVNDVGVLSELNKLLVIEQVDDEIQILGDPNSYKKKQATVDCLSKHWLKLKAANLPVIDGYADFTKKESLQQFYVECLREVKTMKLHRINDRTTLYDLLRMDVHIKYVFIAKNLKELIKSPLITTNFPNYYHLMKAHYYKALARYPLVEPAKRAWDYLTGIRLPDCVEKILVYLENEDLRVMAGEEEEVNSLKRSSRLWSEPAKRKRLN